MPGRNVIGIGSQGFVPGDKVQFCLLMAAVFLTIFGVLDLRNAGQRLARYIRRNSGDNE